MRAVLLIFALLTAHAGPAHAGLETRRITQDGLTRTYLLYTPARLAGASGARPLVLVLHGGGGSARQILRNTRRRFNRLADVYGFHVAYPDAIDGSWDFGDDPISPGRPVRVNDMAYFSAVIDDAGRRARIDGRRIFATGISRGGQASYALACRMPGRIRAIAPVAMPLPEFLAGDCRRGPPVGLVLINGTEDPIVPYDGGAIRIRDKSRGRVLSSDATVKMFRARNRCAGARSRQRTDNRRDGTSVERTEWTGCAGAPVALHRIVGGGHTWPSGRSILPERWVGRTTREFDGADAVWAFFSRFK